MGQQAELFRILMMQHREMHAMLTMLSVPRATRMRAALLPVLEQQLLAHMRAEEQTLYPAVVSADGEVAIDEIAEAKHQHGAMAAALAELRSIDVDGERWDGALQTLTSIVQQHVDEEESDVFEAARQVLDEAELQMLAESFREQRKEELALLGAEDDDYGMLTKQELLDQVSQLGLAGSQSMTNEQLIAILRAGY